MKLRTDLTEGPILGSLMRLALPIMATSFIQMAYNLTDMIWVGRISGLAVASVGTASFYTWFAKSIQVLGTIGAQVGVSQRLGAKDEQGARKFAESAMQLGLILGVIFTLLVFMFAPAAIAIFNYKDQVVIDGAVIYLKIAILGTPAIFAVQIFSAIFNGAGNSRTPFILSAIGLVVNMLLDPILIFGLGAVPAFGIAGAAYATVASQLLVLTLFIGYFAADRLPVKGFSIFRPIDFPTVAKIMKTGLPIALHQGSFTFFSLLLTRIVAQWGPIPVAVQKVGEQIEALSWMTAAGFSSAVTSFAGQNFGAEKLRRIGRGFTLAIGTISIIGLAVTFILINFGQQIFTVFIPEMETSRQGAEYLRILAYSQLFMCIEIVTAGTFSGFGKTIPPAVVGISLTALRVPLALFLTSVVTMDVTGVWWSVTLSSIAKGCFLLLWFLVFTSRRYPQMWTVKPNTCGLQSLACSTKKFPDT